MSNQIKKNRSHFIFQNSAKVETYQPRPGGGEAKKLPQRDRTAHGQNLRNQLQQIEPVFSNVVAQQKQIEVEMDLGLQIEFESFSDIDLAVESLDQKKSRIELRNVRKDGNKTFATVFIPEGKLSFFEKRITEYLDPKKDNKTGPRHSALINTIAHIRAASVRALWTDSDDSFPTSDNMSLWWEVWLPAREHQQLFMSQCKELIAKLGFNIAKGELHFPERSILLIYGSLGQMKQSVLLLNCVAELRRAKESADFFDSESLLEQVEWVGNLEARLKIVGDSVDVPYVCLLDTGVNNAHPLLKNALANQDMHSVNSQWGLNDIEGHGTGMAGLALIGNLTDALTTNMPISIAHRLESVKLVPKDGANGHDPQLHGYLTIEAIAHPTITAPKRKRLFNMAITAKDNRDQGRPSAWSATIDRLIYDTDNDGEERTQKLFIISAGNIMDSNAWQTYPDSNSTDSIHDPAQAWNALTVGAMTHLVDITEPDADAYKPIAESGGLSSFSTTSSTWQSYWPLKPDVVFEGGNVANDAIGAVWMNSLCLLTTNAFPNERLLRTFNATSAASALCARMAAQLMAEYPNLWPESIRGLIVHSAQWTEAMKRHFLLNSEKVGKSNFNQLIRHCGFGEPDLQRALWSLNNSLTLICEDSLYPFKCELGKDPTFREMNLHELPWPLEELEKLGDIEVTMRVTLSYFIEPNPSARGVTARYSYESHGLRFDVKRPLESDVGFRARITAAVHNDTTHQTSADSNWCIGIKGRHKGSLHSDIWTGSAAELASRGVIAIYPARGWWRARKKLKRYDQKVRYSLIVSIIAPDVAVDLYTAIENKIGVPVVIG